MHQSIPVESLLQPVPGDAPTGGDLSLSPEFDTIRELGREDDPTLPLGEWKRALKVADWPGVAAHCERLLSERTKDLRVAAWLVEAAANRHGFAGMAEGLMLCQGLVDQWWDGLYPATEDGDPSARSGSLRWLLLRIERIAPTIAATPPLLGRKRSLAELEAARQRQREVVQGTLDAAKARAEGALLIDDVHRDLVRLGRTAVTHLLDHVAAAVAALAALKRSTDARLGDDGPAFGGARQALEAADDAVKRLGRESGLVQDAVRPAASPLRNGAAAGEPAFSMPVPMPVPTLALAQAGAAADNAAPPLAIQNVLPGAPQTRADALQQLRWVAEFFRRTEPHSPVAYLADKAARWGDLPLHLWLRQVVKDGGSLAQLEDLLGVDVPPQHDQN